MYTTFTIFIQYSPIVILKDVICNVSYVKFNVKFQFHDVVLNCNKQSAADTWLTLGESDKNNA